MYICINAYIYKSIYTCMCVCMYVCITIVPITQYTNDKNSYVHKRVKKCNHVHTNKHMDKQFINIPYSQACTNEQKPITKT